MRPLEIRPPPAQCQGFSLLELLVSMCIGLLIIAAALSAYQGATSASKLAEAQSRMNEDAQAALSILTQHIRMAGNNPVQANRTDASHRNAMPIFTLRGCDNVFGQITTNSATEDLSCTGTGSHSIAIAYEADNFNTIHNTSGLAQPTDCLGNRLTAISTPGVATVTGLATTQHYVAENRFYIGTSTAISGTPSLYCKGNGGLGSPQPLIENIEDLQLTYGTARSSGPGSDNATVAGYLTAAEVSALATNPADNATRWRKVLTVRICVLVRSDAYLVSDTASASYFQCNGQLDTTQTDRRLRRAYATTVALRNRQL